LDAKIYSVTEVLPLSPENRHSNLMTLWGW